MQRIYQIRRPCKIRIAMVLVLSFFVYTCKIKEKQAAGVKVSVLTWHPDMYTFGNSDQRYETIEFLRDEGIYVNLVQERFCEHYAIIDSSIVWYGSVNLLGKEDIDDNIMRVESRRTC